jgi:hypothetical protein
MLAGVMFRPISFKTLLGLEAQYPYGLYCTWKFGRNPIFTQVMGIPFRLMIRSGNTLKPFAVTFGTGSFSYRLQKLPGFLSTSLQENMERAKIFFLVRPQYCPALFPPNPVLLRGLSQPPIRE